MSRSTVFCVMFFCLHASVGQAATWFVRPAGGAYDPGDGKSYKTAFAGGWNVDWWKEIKAGDTLFICGRHTTALYVGASGESGKPITLDGNCPNDNGTFDNGTFGRRALDDVERGSAQILSLFDDVHIVVQNLTFENPFGMYYDWDSGGWRLSAQIPYGTHDDGPSSTALTDVANEHCVDAATYACCADASCNSGHTKHLGLDFMTRENHLRGGVIFNVTDGSRCVITSADEHKITCAAGLSPDPDPLNEKSPDNTWEKGDEYRLLGDTGAIKISGNSHHITIRNNRFNYTSTDVGNAIMLYMIKGTAIDHVTIEDNTFNGGDTGGDVMIVAYWSAHSSGTCNNLTISNNSFNSVEGAFGMWAYSDSDPNGDGDRNDHPGIKHLDISDNTIAVAHGGRWAINLLAVKAPENGFNHVRNNTITTDGTQSGQLSSLEIHWSEKLIVEDNTIEGPTLANSCTGAAAAILIDQGFNTAGPHYISDNVVVRNNTIYGAQSSCTGKGILVRRGRNIDIHNNLIYDGDLGIAVTSQNLQNNVCKAAGQPYLCCKDPNIGTCDTAYESSGVRIFNNTIHNSGIDCPSKNHCGDGIFIDNDVPEVIVRNNIVSASADDGIDTDGGSISSDYNLIYNSASNDCEGFGADQKTCGTNTITGKDPLFVAVSSQNFALDPKSPAIDEGINLFGLAYCDAAPDMGYLEQCGKPVGTSCSDNGACLSGHCVDGVCCDSACDDICYSCNLQTNVRPGQCGPVPANVTDTGCDGELRCNGEGACKPAIEGTCSSAASCPGEHCVDGICCDSACTEPCMACNLADNEGSCKPLPRTWADTFPEDACTGEQSCDGNGMCLNALGVACKGHGDCSSGFCVDGVCCDTACDSPCASCALAGLPAGTCTPDPEDPSCNASRSSGCNCEAASPASTPAMVIALLLALLALRRRECR